MKIISTIFYTIFVALVVGIAGLLLGSMLPIPGNIEVKIVKSGSMEPAIPTGSLVVVKPATEYVKGDIITFGKDTQRDIPTTHRIIAVHQDGTYTVKGDANEEADTNPVARRDIIGKVAIHVPYAGFVLDFARQPLGFALLIGIPAGLVILEELLTIFRESRKWWRRKDGDGEGGTEEPGDLTGHLKRVYAKRYTMDEIFRATYIEPRFFELLWWKGKLGLKKDAYSLSTMLTLGLVFTSMSMAGASGSTLSYFQDLETSVGNIFRAGTWIAAADPQSVVLNEFLPDPEGVAYGFDFGNDNSDMPQGEWIELYNNGDVPIDVTGWFITDASGGAGNTHAIISASNTAPATTTIAAHGWLVVYLNKPSLNDTDEIHLFTATSSGGVEVDFVSYGVPPDFCDLEPTPTEANSTSTPTGTPDSGNSGDCNAAQAAPNKSYARIPDGTGAWVDPIPTPGAPNIPDPDPLPEPLMTDDLIDEEVGEVLGAEDANEGEGGAVPQDESAQAPVSQGGGGGGGGGGGSAPPADEVVVEKEESGPESAAADSGTAPAEETLPTPPSAVEDPPTDPAPGEVPPAELPADGTAQIPVDEPLPEPPPQEPVAESPTEPPPAEPQPEPPPADPAPATE